MAPMRKKGGKGKQLQENRWYQSTEPKDTKARTHRAEPTWRLEPEFDEVEAIHWVADWGRGEARVRTKKALGTREHQGGSAEVRTTGLELPSGPKHDPNRTIETASPTTLRAVTAGLPSARRGRAAGNTLASGRPELQSARRPQPPDP